MRDTKFSDGLGIEVQIRTKLIRFWSYIKNVAVRIGDDILEVEGAVLGGREKHYWTNLEYQGELKEVGGFPVTGVCSSSFKCDYVIDLSSKYQNQSILIRTFKEFVKVEFLNSSALSFGDAVGMLGNYHTGQTLGRDGATVINDFTELGNEWQILPSDEMLFHDISPPQFPNKCIEPEDPRGERRRRLGEMAISEGQAEKACAHLRDVLDRKDCVYDVLATQDISMTAAY